MLMLFVSTSGLVNQPKSAFRRAAASKARQSIRFYSLSLIAKIKKTTRKSVKQSFNFLI
jgi:hypothetical protein